MCVGIRSVRRDAANGMGIGRGGGAQTLLGLALDKQREEHKQSPFVPPSPLFPSPRYEQPSEREGTRNGRKEDSLAAFFILFACFQLDRKVAIACRPFMLP